MLNKALRRNREPEAIPALTPQPEPVAPRLWDRLGLTTEETEKWKGPGIAAFVPALVPCPDGPPVVGISYRTDYRYEEEAGVGHLRRALTGINPRQFHSLPNASEYISYFSDASGLILHTEPVGGQVVKWGDPIITNARWGSSLPGSEYARNNSMRAIIQMGGNYDWILDARVPELRQRAKELNIKPMPSKADDLRLAIATAESGPQREYPAYFEDGNCLILKADGGVVKAIMDALVDAAKAGTLGIGDGSGPFATGLFLYDARDETIGLRAKIDADFAWYDARMAELQVELDRLSEDGYSWRYFGSPLLHDDGVTTYFVNSLSLNDKEVVPHARLTLEAIKDRTFQRREQKVDSAGLEIGS